MPEGPDKLSIIVFDGAFDRVHYALVLASAAAATNRAATLFFSGRAIHALTPQGWQRLDGDPIGQNHRLEASGVAAFEPLLDACRELGVRFIACEMALRTAGLRREDLDPALPIDIAGTVTVLNDAPKTGAMLFI